MKEYIFTELKPLPFYTFNLDFKDQSLIKIDEKIRFLLTEQMKTIIFQRFKFIYPIKLYIDNAMKYIIFGLNSVQLSQLSFEKIMKNLKSLFYFNTNDMSISFGNFRFYKNGNIISNPILANNVNLINNTKNEIYEFLNLANSNIQDFKVGSWIINLVTFDLNLSQMFSYELGKFSAEAFKYLISMQKTWKENSTLDLESVILSIETIPANDLVVIKTRKNITLQMNTKTLKLSVFVLKDDLSPYKMDENLNVLIEIKTKVLELLEKLLPYIKICLF